jgi:transposase InsO family protein
MSMSSRREYLGTMCKRFKEASSRASKSLIINELVSNLGYNRKYAVHALNNPVATLREPVKRKRPIEYIEALPAIQLVWEALDYPCAERLHPVLPSTAEILSNHGELSLTPEIRLQLSMISRATLARRLKRLRSPKCRSLPGRRPNTGLRAEIPVERYDWEETRPGALEIDLVEHNGGSSLGHFAYTLSVVDVVSGYSRRRAVLGRGQASVHRELTAIINDWPTKVWGLHCDNGSEFISVNLMSFCQKKNLAFTRSRPYKKNDNAHVEQKNLQYVREIVGYERYDTPEAVEWLNQVYGILDPYANLFLPMRKVISKARRGSHVCKKFDTARTPFQRLSETGALTLKARLIHQHQMKAFNPLEIHHQIEDLLGKGPLPVQLEPQSTITREVVQG